MRRRIAIGSCALVAMFGCSSDDDQSASSSVGSTAIATVDNETFPATTSSVPSLSASTDATTVAAQTSMPATVPPGVSREALAAVVDRWLVDSEVPGAVVGVQIGDNPPVIVAGGVDARSGVALTVEASFSIASITKTFIGTLALDLVDEGQLLLDDLVAQYVPDFPAAETITIRQLLTHSSGLPPQGGEGPLPHPYLDEFEALILGNLDRAFTPADILAIVADRPLLFEPEAAVRYSNINTLLLGQVIATVTGVDVWTALRTRLLDPLGLTGTYVGGVETGAPISPGMFRLDEGGPLLNTADFPSTGLLTALGPAGALVSTPRDLLRWAALAFRDPTRAADSDLAASRFEVRDDGLGLGVIIRDGTGRDCVFLGGCAAGNQYVAVGGVGSVPGTDSTLMYFPHLDTTVLAIATSSETDHDGTLVDDVLHVIQQSG